MPIRTPPIIAAILTVVLLIFLSIALLFVEVVALNGASERQGILALGVSLVCQGLGLILAAIFAYWLARTLGAKFHWNPAAAVAVAVLAAITLGAVAAFLSTVISIPLAGIR